MRKIRYNKEILQQKPITLRRLASALTLGFLLGTPVSVFAYLPPDQVFQGLFENSSSSSGLPIPNLQGAAPLPTPNLIQYGSGSSSLPIPTINDYNDHPIPTLDLFPDSTTGGGSGGGSGGGGAGNPNNNPYPNYPYPYPNYPYPPGTYPYPPGTNPPILTPPGGTGTGYNSGQPLSDTGPAAYLIGGAFLGSMALTLRYAMKRQKLFN